MSEIRATPEDRGAPAEGRRAISTRSTMTAEELRACCSTAYGSDLVALLLGPAYHPGGGRLTRRLARGLGLRPGQVVVDAAAGPGATARLLASEFGVRVRGFDLSDPLVRQARAAAFEDGQANRVGFAVADAERLPVPDASVDAVICECALCTFPDGERAVREFARVIRPGGRVGIADVVADGRLPPELTSLLAWIACLAGARPTGTMLRMLEGEGLRIRLVERHDAALVELVEGIETRLRLLGAIRSPAVASLDLSRARVLVRAAKETILDGALGYLMAVAERPNQQAKAA